MNQSINQSIVVGKESGGAGSCNFPTDSCKFPTEELMGAQNFNPAPKFYQNEGFPVTNFVFSEENLPTQTTFSDKRKLRVGGGNCPPPYCYDAIN